ncbi:hypothetical protein D3C78_1717560 [compost metagenome]
MFLEKILHDRFQDVRLYNISTSTIYPDFPSIPCVLIPAKFYLNISRAKACTIRGMQTNCVDDFIHTENHNLVSSSALIIVIARLARTFESTVQGHN